MLILLNVLNIIQLIFIKYNYTGIKQSTSSVLFTYPESTFVFTSQGNFNLLVAYKITPYEVTSHLWIFSILIHQSLQDLLPIFSCLLLTVRLWSHQHPSGVSARRLLFASGLLMAVLISGSLGTSVRLKREDFRWLWSWDGFRRSIWPWQTILRFIQQGSHTSASKTSTLTTQCKSIIAR